MSKCCESQSPADGPLPRTFSIDRIMSLQENKFLYGLSLSLFIHGVVYSKNLMYRCIGPNKFKETCMANNSYLKLEIYQVAIHSGKHTR